MSAHPCDYTWPRRRQPPPTRRGTVQQPPLYCFAASTAPSRPTLKVLAAALRARPRGPAPATDEPGACVGPQRDGRRGGQERGVGGRVRDRAVRPHALDHGRPRHQLLHSRGPRGSAHLARRRVPRGDPQLEPTRQGDGHGGGRRRGARGRRGGRGGRWRSDGQGAERRVLGGSGGGPRARAVGGLERRGARGQGGVRRVRGEGPVRAHLLRLWGRVCCA